MAIVLKLAGFDSSNARALPSPLTELMALLHALAEPDHHFEAGDTLNRVANSLEPEDLDEFRALSPLWARYRCRLFFPLAPQPATLEQQLQLLRDLPVLEFVRLCAEGIHGYARQLPSPQALMNDDGARTQFLEYCAARSSSRLELAEALLRDPPAFRHRLLTFLARCEAAFFARDWATVQDVIHRSATKTTAKLRADGAWKTLAGLSETARGREDLRDVRFDKLQQRSVALDGRELVLVPSVRIGPHLTIKDTPGYPVVVHFGAVETLDEGLGIRQVRDRLSALASETRMEILRHLSAEPITTSELALRLQQNPAQISRAIGVLRDAGLVQSERRGKLVYHRIDTARVLRLGPDIISTLVR